MDKLAVWVFAALLGYICFVLTSINGKLDDLNASGAQVAVLNEVKPQSFTGNDVQQIVYREAAPSVGTSMQAGFLLAAMISIFVSWHTSRIYHTHQWTKRMLKKTFTTYSEPHIVPARRDPVHVDQDCVGDPPRPDGRIKQSWLPAHAKELYVSWGRA